MSETLLGVTGMTCADCAQHIEQALSRIPGVQTVRVDYPTGVARIVSELPLAIDALTAGLPQALYGEGADGGSHAQAVTRKLAARQDVGRIGRIEPSSYRIGRHTQHCRHRHGRWDDGSRHHCGRTGCPSHPQPIGMKKLPGILAWEFQTARAGEYYRVLYMDSHYGDVVKYTIFNADGAPLLDATLHDYRAVQGIRVPFAIDYLSPDGKVLANDRLQRVEVTRMRS